MRNAPTCNHRCAQQIPSKGGACPRRMIVFDNSAIPRITAAVYVVGAARQVAPPPVAFGAAQAHPAREGSPDRWLCFAAANARPWLRSIRRKPGQVTE